jgi:hypothetical protein
MGVIGAVAPLESIGAVGLTAPTGLAAAAELTEAVVGVSAPLTSSIICRPPKPASFSFIPPS